MGIAGAIAGTAVAGLAGSALSSSAASSAAKTQAAAANNATSAAEAENAQTQANLAPYDQYGQNATNQLGNLSGANGVNAQDSAFGSYGMSGPTFQPTQAQLSATPGYQFDLSQGLNSVSSSNAAKGLGVSGAALKDAATFATGLANNTLTTQAGIYQQNYNNIINPLQSGASLGESAAVQAGSLGTQNTANANNALMAGANASAAGTVSSANNIASGLTGLGGAGTNYLLMNNLMGSGNAATTSAIGGGAFA